MYERLHQIRTAEAESHAEAYTRHELFAPGSWLEKPVKTVLELRPLFADCTEFHGLDLGCGIGRNCIPLAQFLNSVPCHMDCVDILPLAIDKLAENARRFQVSASIKGIVSSIDAYPIQKDYYDLILAVSALEHVASRDTFVRKLKEIRNGLRPGGIACLIVNTSVVEQDKESGSSLPPQFEVNLLTPEMQHLLEDIFHGWQVLKNTIVHQKYDIPKKRGISALETDVITWVVKNEMSW